MAVEQPLTSFSNAISDATLRGIDIDAPRIRALHAAFDACAEEAGPLRFEPALRVTSDSVRGAFHVMADAPSEALAALFAIAPAARERFADTLAIWPGDRPADGDINAEEIAIIGAEVRPCGPMAPMDTFLAALEQDPQTSPSSLESLFEQLELAAEAGLVIMDAQTIGLDAAGRDQVELARETLGAMSAAALRCIDLHAQEVADGRMSLRQAMAAVGMELGLQLPLPGSPDPRRDAEQVIDAQGRVDAGLFDPLVAMAATLPSRSRMAVAVLALQMRLSQWGVSVDSAERIMRHDIRCLRAFGASLSHGPLGVAAARRLVEEDGAWDAVVAAAECIDDDVLFELCGPSRMPTNPVRAKVSSVAEPGAHAADRHDCQERMSSLPAGTAGRRSILRRLLDLFLR